MTAEWDLRARTEVAYAGLGSDALCLFTRRGRGEQERRLGKPDVSSNRQYLLASQAVGIEDDAGGVSPRVPAGKAVYRRISAVMDGPTALAPSPGDHGPLAR